MSISKIIKDFFLDSTGIMHNRKLLSDILQENTVVVSSVEPNVVLNGKL